ncbi:hypothetical protein Tco_1298439 [Tanacetum coccineum]
MIDCLSIVETDKVSHTVETDIVKLVVEIESFGMSSDEVDKETRSSDRLLSKQVDLSCVHALNELHLHEICVVPSKHECNTPKNVSQRKYVRWCYDDDDGDSGWRWWRVAESGYGDRVDPVMRTTLGVDRKIPPEKFSGGGWPEKMAVAGGEGLPEIPC